MKKETKELLADSIRQFALPRYQEIPAVGLYLEQTTKYISDYLAPLNDITITGSMISNYVKKKLVANPVKKQYGRDQIAYLIFIAIAKSALSLDHILLLIEMQKKSYDNQTAYDYFCQELENILQDIFGLRDEDPNMIEKGASDEKILLHNLIVTAAHKIYLSKCFGAIRLE